jgi:phosphinothricin acetyltransferase
MTQHTDLRVREVAPADAEALAAIYNHYVQHTLVTFEEEPVSSDVFALRVAAIRDKGLPYLVAEHHGEVIGYASASPWKERYGYRFSLECSVYVAPGRHRQGVGSALYRVLFPHLDALGKHALMGGIALPNDASVALHERFGMRKVAHFSEVGFKFGAWVDVGYWQRINRG